MVLPVFETVVVKMERFELPLFQVIFQYGPILPAIQYENEFINILPFPSALLGELEDEFTLPFRRLVREMRYDELEEQVPNPELLSNGTYTSYDGMMLVVNLTQPLIMRIFRCKLEHSYPITSLLVSLPELGLIYGSDLSSYLFSRISLVTLSRTLEHGNGMKRYITGYSGLDANELMNSEIHFSIDGGVGKATRYWLLLNSISSWNPTLTSILDVEFISLVRITEEAKLQWNHNNLSSLFSVPELVPYYSRICELNPNVELPLPSRRAMRRYLNQHIHVCSQNYELSESGMILHGTSRTEELKRQRLEMAFNFEGEKWNLGIGHDGMNSAMNEVCMGWFNNIKFTSTRVEGAMVMAVAHWWNQNFCYSLFEWINLLYPSCYTVSKDAKDHRKVNAEVTVHAAPYAARTRAEISHMKDKNEPSLLFPGLLSIRKIEEDVVFEKCITPPTLLRGESTTLTMDMKSEDQAIAYYDSINRGRKMKYSIDDERSTFTLVPQDEEDSDPETEKCTCDELDFEEMFGLQSIRDDDTEEEHEYGERDCSFCTRWKCGKREYFPGMKWDSRILKDTRSFTQKLIPGVQIELSLEVDTLEDARELAKRHYLVVNSKWPKSRLLEVHFCLGIEGCTSHSCRCWVVSSTTTDYFNGFRWVEMRTNTNPRTRCFPSLRLWRESDGNYMGDVSSFQVVKDEKMELKHCLAPQKDDVLMQLCLWYKRCIYLQGNLTITSLLNHGFGGVNIEIPIRHPFARMGESYISPRWLIISSRTEELCDEERLKIFSRPGLERPVYSTLVINHSDCSLGYLFGEVDMDEDEEPYEYGGDDEVLVRPPFNLCRDVECELRRVNGPTCGEIDRHEKENEDDTSLNAVKGSKHNTLCLLSFGESMYSLCSVDKE